MLTDAWNIGDTHLKKRGHVSQEIRDNYGKETAKLWREWRTVARRDISTIVARK